MTGIHTKILFFFILVFVFVTTGCISENSVHNSSGSSGTNTPVFTVVPTQYPPASGNATPYIIIHSIGYHNIGDVFEINGTTNLSADSRIIIEVREETHLAIGPNDTTYYVESESKGPVRIQKGSGPENFWSYSVNMTGFHGQRNYEATVYIEQGTYPHSVINYSFFYVFK
jgi:hypothetical protein